LTRRSHTWYPPPSEEEHLVTYLRLLDADAGGLDWEEASRVILLCAQTVRALK
jgi:hypothetical protein